MSSDSLRDALYEFEVQNYGAISQGKKFVLGIVPASTLIAAASELQHLNVGFSAVLTAAVIYVVIFIALVAEWLEFRASTGMLYEWWDQRRT